MDIEMIQDASTTDDSTSSSETVAEASLLGVLQHKRDAFDIIVEFVGNPFDFRRLGQTCHAMNKYFALDNDDVWKKSFAYKDPKVHDEDFGDYSKDDRLPSAWEKSMVKAVLEKVYLEQRKEDNIFWDEMGQNDVALFLCHAFDIFDATSVLRADTAFAFAALIEANMIEYLSSANRLACVRDSISTDSFPCITPEDFFDARLVSRDEAFEGPTASKFKIKTMTDEQIEELPVSDKIVRRLAYRAGAIKLTNEAMEYARKMIVWLIYALPDVMAGTEDIFAFCQTLQHPINIHMKKFPPKKCRHRNEWVPTPGMLTMAAKALRLPITTVYDTEERYNIDDFLPFYYNPLTPKEKHEYKLSKRFTYNPMTDYDFKENEIDNDNSSGEYDDDESMEEGVDDDDQESVEGSAYEYEIKNRFGHSDFEDDDVSMDSD